MPISSFAAANQKRATRLPGKGLFPALIAFFALPALSQAQEKFCILSGRDSLSAQGTPVKQCLDVGALDGKTHVIPSNTVRIDGKGFSLCENSDSTGGKADLVYVYDNSGSMASTHFSVFGPDTTFYYGRTGCSSPSSSDVPNIPISVWNFSGTAQVSINVTKVASGNGCSALSGDPYNARGRAFRLGIASQSDRAPQSTAGLLSFTDGVALFRRPTVLNTPANVTLVHSGINAVSGGGTNYTPPLDTARRWLTTAITSNPTKGVIFLSDGRPSNTSYLGTIVNASMPPIYGIFLGKDTVGTGPLLQMSQITNGQFFLIPPNRPDSLVAVVSRILNIVLLNFQPNSATVLNRSLSPPQSGTAGPTDFVRQADNSWLINFSSEVALRESTTNDIGFTSDLRETRTGNLKPNNANFVLSATGPAATANGNVVGTQFSVSCFDKPIDPNIVTSAYIKDENGDGRGDKVYLVFTRPLASPPSSLDAYWNRMGPAFKNPAAPVLSFMAGSNSRVLVADFSGSQFPLGMTGIPSGLDTNGLPRAVLPPGGVFVAQRPFIADSIGPIIDSGTAYPFDVTRVNASGNLTVDTLRISLSEMVVGSSSTDYFMFKFGKPVNGKCTDYANARQVIPYGRNISIDPLTNVATVLVSSAEAPVPLAGDCIYLNTDGTYSDAKRNKPPVYGVILKGRRPARQIELFRGYPPVAGLSPSDPGFVLANNDPRKGTPMDFSKPGPDGVTHEVPWIPPVGFVNSQSSMSNAAPGFSPTTPSTGTDNNGVRVMPRDISAIQVISTAKYIATVVIYDNHGNFIVTFRQKFGYDGEMNNRERIANRGMVSYLWWDLRAASPGPGRFGQRVGQGVYIWKVNFLFENKKEEIEYTRTGVMRPPLLP